MSWNKKNDQFALMCGLRPSATLLLRWILRRAKLNQVDEIEIDLRVFNAWVAKNRGTPFDRKTIREIIAQLDEKTWGMITITKDYTPWIKKVLVRPLEMVLQNNAQDSEQIPKLKSGNPMFSDDHKNKLLKQQQQDISKLDSILSNVGLRFTPDNLVKLWRLAGKSLSNMKSAIEYLLHANSTQKTPIGNAKGFFTECLKYSWYKGFNLNYQTELPRFSTSRDLAEFVKAAFMSDGPTNKCVGDGLIAPT